MKAIQSFQMHKELDDIKLASTRDDRFARPAIVIDNSNPNETLSVDLMVKVEGKTYHIARMNVVTFVSGNGKTIIDLIAPDSVSEQIQQWREGRPVLNMVNNDGCVLSLTFTPSSEL